MTNSPNQQTSKSFKILINLFRKISRSNSVAQLREGRTEFRPPFVPPPSLDWNRAYPATIKKWWVFISHHENGAFFLKKNSTRGARPPVLPLPKTQDQISPPPHKFASCDTAAIRNWNLKTKILNISSTHLSKKSKF